MPPACSAAGCFAKLCIINATELKPPPHHHPVLPFEALLIARSPSLVTGPAGCLSCPGLIWYLPEGNDSRTRREPQMTLPTWAGGVLLHLRENVGGMEATPLS